VTATECPSCRWLIEPGDRYCEKCGHELERSASPDSGVERRLVTGEVQTGTTRVVWARPTADHVELDLHWAAAVSDRGRRHTRNEDAFALATAGDRVAVVVCDGVSMSANPARASAAASQAALRVLQRALSAPAWPGPAQAEALLVDALVEAYRAVAAVPGTNPAAPLQPGDYDQLPATTIVAALVGDGRASVASVGDSRAYWISAQPEQSRRLTVDDSWVEEAVAEGMDPDEAQRDPQAHVITRWLGADVTELSPHLATMVVDDGVLVVCTDGLWNDFAEAGDLRDLLLTTGGIPPQDPLVAARSLVTAALQAGGHDNITVAVIASPPSPPYPGA